MNSLEIKTQIKTIDARIWDTERLLKVPNNVDDGLTLQRELDSLTAYRTRLNQSLETIQADEDISRKERELADLDTFLTDSLAKADDLKSEISNLIRRGDLGLEALYEAVKPIRDELWTLSAHYERSYRLRNGYGDWIPNDKRIIVNTLAFMPSGLQLEKEAERVTWFALDTLYNEKNSNGLTLYYVDMAITNLQREFNLP
jgi:predicted RNase H-like nuclease (RuvC/YqgF family)